MYTKIQYFLLNENIQQAKTILKELDLDPDKETDFKEITKSLERLPNLIGKFVEFQYKDKAPKEDVKRVMTWIITNRDLVSKLPKNILQYDHIEELEDDIKELTRLQKINKFYKSLYASMRAQVDKLDKDKRKEFNDLALAYMELPEAEQKQFTPLKYFERNNISITDFIKSLSSFLDKSEVNEDKKNVLDKIEKYGDRVEILYNMNNVLVIETENFEAVKNLGAQSWCIVYGGDGYRNSYFGPETNNTQLIIFNFNLPSTAANSMFGVTIKPTMEIIGCQDKMNHYVGVENIKLLTGLPDSIFKPNEAKAAAYVVENTIKSFTDSIAKEPILNKENLTLHYLINKLLEKLNEIEDKTKFEDALDTIIGNTFKRIFTHEYTMQTVFLNTFKYKTPEDIYKIIKENKYIDTILKKSIDYKHIIFISTFLGTAESCHFFVLYYFELFKNSLDFIDEYWVAWYLGKKHDRFRVVGDYTIWSYSDVSQLEKEKYPIEISSEAKNVFIKLFKKIREDISGEIINHPRETLTFDEYKKVYDSIGMNDEYPYQFFIEQELYVDAAPKFIDDEKYRNFMIDVINSINDDAETDKSLIMDNICQNAYYDYSDDLLDKYDDETVDMYEKTNSSPPFSDHILGLLMYKKTDKYGQTFRKQMKIESYEGQDCVVVPDFTSFDRMIFKEEYFNQIEDYDMYYEKYDDWSLKDQAEDLDNYNLIDVTEMIEKEIPEVKLLSDSIKSKYFVEGKIDKTLMDKYERDEDLKKLEKDLIRLIFDTDTGELNEIDENLYDYLNDDIKKDIFNRALNNAYEAAYHEALWNKLMEAVENALGGSDWKQTEEEIKYKKKPKIYKYRKNDKDSWDLLFTIDISYIVESVESYSDLHYNQGEKFDWEDLLTYIYKIVQDPIKMYLEDINPWVTKEYFNEALRNL